MTYNTRNPGTGTYNVRQRSRVGRSGFSLLELLVVVAIMLLIIGAFLVQFTSARELTAGCGNWDDRFALCNRSLDRGPQPPKYVARANTAPTTVSNSPIPY
ncbi:MAG: type II secretion system protein [Planctomycetota bacterium]|jgi:prepilin-type N-terminal cleavage/methylation domain-containing protein